MAADINMSHARFDDPLATIPNYHATAQTGSVSSKSKKKESLRAAQQKWLDANTGVVFLVSASAASSAAVNIGDINASGAMLRECGGC